MYINCKIYSFSHLTEWTSTLLKFMKEQLMKLQDYYQNQNQSLSLISMVPVGGLSAADEHRLAMKQWQYCTSLAKHMYQVNIFQLTYLK